MQRDRRNELMETYFTAMDAGEVDILDQYLAEDFTYELQSGVLEGPSGVKEYVNKHRSLSDTTHKVRSRLHGEVASVAEGKVFGVGRDDREVSLKFCDVFEFNDHGEGFTRIAVYVNDG